MEENPDEEVKGDEEQVAGPDRKSRLQILSKTSITANQDRLPTVFEQSEHWLDTRVH